ncbi:MAG TPA: hypothetical protein VMU25_02525 [Candidatus Paceibacterota bacterium]|nr:hypothetical protein [Candidatus Paceibacterota bacterium]
MWLRPVPGKGNPSALTQKECEARTRGWRFGAWVNQRLKEARKEVEAEEQQRKEILDEKEDFS